MKNRTWEACLFPILCFALAMTSAQADDSDLAKSFENPAESARPGVYWYFMDGNMESAEMLTDLKAMKDVGIGSVLFLEVDLGVPRGPVPFMSEQWQDKLSTAFVEAGKMGLEVILGTGPGWSGSGGSWVTPEDSMQHLVGNSIQVSGPGVLDQKLDVPPPHPPNPFSGMSAEHDALRNKWFNEVAVIAFPTPAGEIAKITEFDIKTLKDVLPYSIRRTHQRFVMPQAEYAEPDPTQVIDFSKVIDLTSKMQTDGSIRWEIPEGDWTIMRFVARSTGQTTRPAPRAGHGFENNKFDGASFRRHWENFQAKLIKQIVAKGGPLQPSKGLTTIHLDSWEMSSQNWTAAFREEFRKRRGYDPQAFFPAYMGLVVGSLEKTERFLWDMRKVSQELVLEQHAGVIKQVAHENGLLYSNEPYDMNPAGDIDLGSIADIPMCEFWNVGSGADTQYSCIEAASISHTMGPQIVKAESFTSGGEAYAKNPANMKNQTDWAFAIGINGIIFHTFQHQALGGKEKPGMGMGPYGIQWNRNNSLWEYLPGYHEYLTRCSDLLRQGEAVADILYLIPEGAPHIFEAPEDATEGVAKMRDKKGYSFDAVSPRILAMRAKVEGDRIAFPDGSKYRILVLPDVPTMTPEALKVIEKLVSEGATVIGNPPVESPSLVNFPACDDEVATLSKSIWKSTDAPEKVTQIHHGKGSIFWGGELKAVSDLYPSYQATASVLSGLGLPQDFVSPSGKLRFIHRETEKEDVYFVSNRSEESVVTEGVFRIEGRQPQLWDPVTAEMRLLKDYEPGGGVTRVPLSFEPLQSFFVIFPKSATGAAPVKPSAGNFPTLNEFAEITGPWNVAFDPAWGGPEKIIFDKLLDWSTHPDEGIRYYSGVAIYRKSFDLDSEIHTDDGRLYLDLGEVHDLCKVRLNGKDLGLVWTAPWRVDVTSALKEKGNELEIEVVNGWVNRLVGDQQEGNSNVRKVSWPSGLLGGTEYGADRYTFATHRHYAANSPLLPAGLRGPVTILSSGPDRTAPRPTGHQPAVGETTRFLPGSVAMTFNEPIKTGTGKITIRNLTDKTEVGIGITEAAQVTVKGNRLSITPADGLLAGKKYSIRIDPGVITDNADNAFPGIADDAKWNFNTGTLKARVVVQDGFSGSFVSGNGAITGRVPDGEHLEDSTYTEQQNVNNHARMELDTSGGNPEGSLKTGFNNSAHIRFNHGQAPTKAVTLSIDVQIGTIQDDDLARGIGLGFWSTPPTLFPGTEINSTTRFTGILVNPTGTLEYVREGTSQGVFTEAPAGFSKDAFLNLTYTIDPTSKKLLHLEFGGSDHTDAFQAKFPNDFTISDTAGFLGNTAQNPNAFGRVDNFVIAIGDE